MKPVIAGNERLFGFADLTALRQIAGELQQGTTFRAVVRTLQSSRTGQLAFDFRLDAHPARILELKPRTRRRSKRSRPAPKAPFPLGPLAPRTIGTGVFGALECGRTVFPDGIAPG